MFAQSKTLVFPTRLGLARGPARGFTLIELMVVVVIIAILATISVPLFVGRMKERRAQQTALQVAGIYREARMRALGRGASVLVAFDGDKWEVREGIEGTTAAAARGASAACKDLPTRGCLTNTWDNDNTSRVVGNLGAGALANLTTQANFGGSAQDSVDVCFSPLGRAFIRTEGGAWNPMSSVLTVDMKREEGDDVGLTRTVVVLPNGTARLAL